MANEKIFTIKINGVEKSYSDVVKLRDILKEITDVQAKVTVETDRANKSNEQSSRTSKEKAKALTEEEKAAKKLADTQDKASRVITQIERDQVAANQQLRERTRSLQLQVQAENAATNSIESMRVELSRLKDEWKKLDVDSVEFEELSKTIDELNEKIKQHEQATGDFRRNVGNYESATKGLEETLQGLGEGINQTAEQTKGLLNMLQAGAGALVLFGGESDDTKEMLSNLGKVMFFVNAIQAANNTLIKNGTLLQKARILVDTLVTKGIITQTTAQTALNIATKAFPLLAVIAVIGTVIGLLSSYSKKTKEAANDTDNLKSSTESLKKESEQTASSLASSLLVYKRLQRQWNDLANDLDRKKKFVTDNKNEFNSLGIEVNNVNDAENVLVTNTDTVIKSLKLRAQAAAAQQIATEKYVEALKKQDEADRRGKNPTPQESAHGKNVYTYEDRDGFKNVPTYQGNELAIEASKPIKEEGEKLLKEADTFFDKYIDLTNKSTEELTSVGIKAATKLNSEIKNTTKNTGDELAKIREDLANERIKAIEDTEQREISTIQSNLQKRLSTIKGNTEEEKELRKLLTENSEKDIVNIRKKYQEQREKEEKDNIQKTIKNSHDLINLEMAQLDTFYNSIESRLDNLEVKNSGGIINVEATRKNIDEANKSLTEYLGYLQKSKKQIEQYYNEILTHYDKDSIEYKQLLLEKQNALIGFQKQEAGINKEITDNTKKETELQSDYWKQAGEKIQGYIDSVMNGVTAIFDGVNSILQAQLDEANEKYDAISQKYDEVVEKREESDSRIQELEERAKTARGGRSLILQQQITQEMEANKQLADQEKRLAKEKEKQEKEIAKKERQMKKAQIASDIVSGMAGTALAVINALQVKPFPLGVVLASVAGAMGAVQVGVMTKQLSKLEDGGLLNGKRHSQGGMRVEGTNIEVEGGEYVINRESTNKNLGLIQYINNQRRELTPTDINSFFSKSSQGFEPPFKRMFEAGGQLPTITDSVNTDNEIIADAIRSMKIEPRVAVTDINDAQTDIVKVDNWTGL